MAQHWIYCNLPFYTAEQRTPLGKADELLVLDGTPFATKTMDKEVGWADNKPQTVPTASQVETPTTPTAPKEYGQILPAIMTPVLTSEPVKPIKTMKEILGSFDDWLDEADTAPPCSTTSNSDSVDWATYRIPGCQNLYGVRDSRSTEEKIAQSFYGQGLATPGTVIVIETGERITIKKLSDSNATFHREIRHGFYHEELRHHTVVWYHQPV